MCGDGIYGVCYYEFAGLCDFFSGFEGSLLYDAECFWTSPVLQFTHLFEFPQRLTPHVGGF